MDKNPVELSIDLALCSTFYKVDVCNFFRCMSIFFKNQLLIKYSRTYELLLHFNGHIEPMRLSCSNSKNLIAVVEYNETIMNIL